MDVVKDRGEEEGKTFDFSLLNRCFRIFPISARNCVPSCVRLPRMGQRHGENPQANEENVLFLEHQSAGEHPPGGRFAPSKECLCSRQTFLNCAALAGTHCWLHYSSANMRKKR